MDATESIGSPPSKRGRSTELDPVVWMFSSPSRIDCLDVPSASFDDLSDRERFRELTACSSGTLLVGKGRTTVLGQAGGGKARGDED